jgi:hypothetical protein
MRRSGLVGTAGRLQFQKLTGGVSSDIWLVSAGSESFCVKRALPQLRVAADRRPEAGAVTAGRRWPSSDYSALNFNGVVRSVSRPFANWKF